MGCFGGFEGIGIALNNVLLELLSQDLTNIGALFSNVALLQKMVNIIFDMISKGPKDVEACTGVYGEASEGVSFILHHLSPAQIVANLVSNLTTNIFAILSLVWSLFTSVISFQWYNM